jgi:hypothetical protein
MPCINIQINPIGPVLEIGVSTPVSLNAAGAAAPPITYFKALADTGCSHTSIHSSVATACGLKVMGKSGASTPAGNIAINIYHGDIFFRSLIGWKTPFEWAFNDRGLCEMVHKNAAFDILLGMDILSTGLFVVNGGLRQASFCW